MICVLYGVVVDPVTTDLATGTEVNAHSAVLLPVGVNSEQKNEVTLTNINEFFSYISDQRYVIDTSHINN